MAERRPRLDFTGTGGPPGPAFADLDAACRPPEGSNPDQPDVTKFADRVEKSKNKNYDIVEKDGVATEVKWKGKK